MKIICYKNCLATGENNDSKYLYLSFAELSKDGARSAKLKFYFPYLTFFLNSLKIKLIIQPINTIFIFLFVMI